MPILNPYHYAHTVIDGDKMLKDHGNHYRLIGQKPYKGKPEKGLAAGTTVTLQVMEDHADPGIDKKTGQPKENNMLQVFDATIVGANFPLPYTKGDEISLGGFMPEASFYIDFHLILRFTEIRKYIAPGGSTNDHKVK